MELYVYRMDDDMMMIDERLFDQEWVQELPADARWLYLYLLAKASRKTGIIELNMRMINFGAATEHKYTMKDVLTIFGNRIQLIPGKESTAIIVDYIATNWAKNGKPIDTARNPLFKAVVAELERYGLSIEAVNRMANKKIAVEGGSDAVADSPAVACDTDERADAEKVDARVSGGDIDRMFAAFWEAYPGPRKVDKRKCGEKFARILRGSKDPVKMFNGILAGIDRWKKTDTWHKDDGRFICAPLVWLNNERWEAEIKEGTYNEHRDKSGSSNSNYRAQGCEGIF